MLLVLCELDYQELAARNLKGYRHFQTEEFYQHCILHGMNDFLR